MSSYQFWSLIETGAYSAVLLVVVLTLIIRWWRKP